MLEIILTRIKARVKMNMEGDNHERIFFQGDTQNLEKRWMARGCLCRRSSSIQAPDKAGQGNPAAPGQRLGNPRFEKHCETVWAYFLSPSPYYNESGEYHENA